jgi:hypothetical protein
MVRLRPETIRTWGREAQDIEVAVERAPIIAEFVNAVATTARNARTAIPFEAEPIDFLRALQRWRGQRR